MTPHPSAPRTSFHHGDLRAQLVRAVAQLVEDKGPEGFSIAEAARAAGVSSGAPYKHFADRSALLRAVAADGMDHLRAAMDAAGQGRGSEDAIIEIGLAYVGYAKAHPGVFRLMFGLTDGHNKSPELTEIGRRTFGVVEAATARHFGQEITAPAVAETAYHLWAHVHGHAFLVIDDKRKSAVKRLDDRYYVTRACRGILSQHGHPP